MREVKKVLAGFLTCVLIFMNTGYVKAEEPIDEITMANTIMEVYKNVLTQRDTTAVEDLLADSDSTFCDYLEWRIAVMEILDVGYSNYEYLMTDVNLVTQGELSTLQICYNETYTYCNGAGTGCGSGHILSVVIQNFDTNPEIKDMYLENEEFFEYFSQQMSGQNSRALNATDATGQNGLYDMINDLYELKNEMAQVEAEQVCSSEMTQREQEIMPCASSYYYSGARGAAYANKYVSNANSYFYSTGSDCTNFVSQCIWAGYGGWTATMSTSTMQSNISNKVRMVSGTWYAGSGGGSSAWESVNALWNFAVGNTGRGPKATGYNNGGYYTEILPIDIGVGDVLQKSNEGSSYYHSMYVISTPGGSNPGYNEILIAQHSSNGTKTLTESLALGGHYLRQMKFVENSFDS